MCIRIGIFKLRNDGLLSLVANDSRLLEIIVYTHILLLSLKSSSISCALPLKNLMIFLKVTDLIGYYFSPVITMYLYMTVRYANNFSMIPLILYR